MSGEESRREKDSLENDENGSSSSSHDVGMDDSISPGEGRRIPVLGSLTAALAMIGVVEVTVVYNDAENILLRNFRRCGKFPPVLMSSSMYSDLQSP